MAKSNVIVADGNEIRGFVFRIYPTREQEEALLVLEDRMRRVWNMLVRQTEDWLRAREAYAVKQGKVPPRPIRPNYDGMTPDESKAARKAHGEACFAWSHAVYEATKADPACAPIKFKDMLIHFGVKHDYQFFKKVVQWQTRDDEESVEIGAALLQSLAKNYFQQAKRRKRFRKKSDSMPVQVRTGTAFTLGEFGDRGRSHAAASKSFYNCQVTIAGMKIRGRLPGRAPWGRVLEGVSLMKTSDGWQASIKQEVPKRTIPAPTPGTVVGIDVGLDNVAAFSDGRVIRNHRGAAYAQRIAGLQAEKKPTGRLQQRALRHARHVIYNEVIKPLALTEVIAVEKLSSRVGQMGSAKASNMRRVITMLQERYGDRVREVPPAYTSQDCSQCGHRSKESWSYEHGRTGECPSCGHRQDRDINAARNIAAKAAKELVV